MPITIIITVHWLIVDKKGICFNPSMAEVYWNGRSDHSIASSARLLAPIIAGTTNHFFFFLPTHKERDAAFSFIIGL